MNLCGALAGTAVAATVGQGLVDAHCVTGATLICGLLGAVLWNLLTWRLGLPSSSSHALSRFSAPATWASAMAAMMRSMGVGAARSFRGLRWHLVESIIWTWVMTLPATGLLAYGLMRLFQALGGAT